MVDTSAPPTYGHLHLKLRKLKVCCDLYLAVAKTETRGLKRHEVHYYNINIYELQSKYFFILCLFKIFVFKCQPFKISMRQETHPGVLAVSSLQGYINTILQD